MQKLLRVKCPLNCEAEMPFQIYDVQKHVNTECQFKVEQPAVDRRDSHLCDKHKSQQLFTEDRYYFEEYEAYKNAILELLLEYLSCSVCKNIIKDPF